MKKIARTALLALMCAALLCGQTACITFNKGGSEQSETAADTAVGSSYTPPTKDKTPSGGELARERLKALPDKDMSGSKIIITTTDGTTVCPSGDGTAVSAARNDVKKAVEEKYQTEILVHTADSKTLLKDVRAAINSDTYYSDLIAIPQSEVGTFMTEGLLANLRSLPFTNLDAEYYNKRITSAAVAGDGIYAAGISASVNPEYLTCVFYNLDLAEELGIENLYDVVKLGDWTWDKLTEYSELAADKGESFYGHGSMLEKNLFTDVAAHSMGFDYVTNELHSLPNVDYLSSDRADDYSSATDLLASHMYGGRAFTDKDALGSFASGNMLFLTGRLYVMSWILDADVNWGVLPMPKFDAEDAEYLSLMAPEAPVFCVISNTPGYETSGLILEALAAASYGYTEEGYVQSCIDRYIRHEGSIDMLELIAASASTDFAHMYASGFRYTKEATYDAFYKAVTTKTTLKYLYSTYRSKANYYYGVMKIYGD